MIIVYCIFFTFLSQLQVDETFLRRRKYNRGRLTSGHTITIFGVYCRETKEGMYWHVSISVLLHFVSFSCAWSTNFFYSRCQTRPAESCGSTCTDTLPLVLSLFPTVHLCTKVVLLLVFRNTGRSLIVSGALGGNFIFPLKFLAHNFFIAFSFSTDLLVLQIHSAIRKTSNRETVVSRYDLYFPML